MVGNSTKNFFFSFPLSAKVETNKFSGSSLIFSRFFPTYLNKEDVVFSGASFLWQYSTRQSIWHGPWVLSSVPCILYSCQSEISHSPVSNRRLQHKSCPVSFLPSRFLFSLNFWSFHVPSYSFRSMMFFKCCV